jgi:Tol biopolymer transport system component
VTKTTAALIVLLLSGVPALGYHRQTPPVVALTLSGDSTLPRLRSAGRKLVIALDTNGRQIFLLDRRDNTLHPVTTQGHNDNPTANQSGHILAWDSDCSLLDCPEPGRQIFLLTPDGVTQVTHDPTGTSVNPALSGKGSLLAFESTGDLANTGNPGTRHVFRRLPDGSITQTSYGDGTSRNPAFDKSGRRLVYESTNNLNGHDTGIYQVWLSSGSGGIIGGRITDGEGPSTNASISPEGRVVVFQSTADLTGDRHDTGVSQIFAYETRGRVVSQITNSPAGCTNAAVARAAADWVISYVCGNEGYLRLLNANRTQRLPIDGDVFQAVTELGRHFMGVSTNVNLLGTGTTPGRQIYMLNIFKYPLEPVP